MKKYRASLSTPKRRKIIRSAFKKGDVAALGNLHRMLASLKKKTSAVKRNAKFTRKLFVK